MSSTPFEVGCLDQKKTQELMEQGFINKLGGIYDEDQCHKRSAELGSLCNNDKNAPCTYFGRTADLRPNDKGDCYVIGHAGKKLEFNKAIYDNAGECPRSGDMTKTLRLVTTDSDQYKEGQKKVAQQKLEELNKDIKSKRGELSKTKLFIKCLNTGKSYSDCLMDEARGDLLVKEEEERKLFEMKNTEHKRVQSDYEKGKALLKQFEKRHQEMESNIDKQNKELKAMKENIQLKNQLIDINNNIFEEADDRVMYMKITIYLLVGLAILSILYVSMDHITMAVKSVQRQVSNLTGNMNLGLSNNFSNVKLRNLKDFSF